jgi:hypothetical protein
MNAPHWRYVLAIVEHALELMAIDCMVLPRPPFVGALPTNRYCSDGELSSNERVRIATDDPVARDHIVRLYARPNP